MFVIGKNFTIVTDHRPLVSLFNTPTKPGPFRVERLRLKLQGFVYTVIYKSGKWNPSDYLSRHPQLITASSKEELEDSMQLECHVINRIQTDIPAALTLLENQKATLMDPV